MNFFITMIIILLFILFIYYFHLKWIHEGKEIREKIGSKPVKPRKATKLIGTGFCLNNCFYYIFRFLRLFGCLQL